MAAAMGTLDDGAGDLDRYWSTESLDTATGVAAIVGVFYLEWVEIFPSLPAHGGAGSLPLHWRHRFDDAVAELLRSVWIVS